LLAIAMSLATGCNAFQPKPPPAPFAAPQATIDTAAFVGTPLGGPTTRPAVAPARPTDALAVRITLVSLEKVSTAGDPLASVARLVSATRLGTPVLPTARLTRAARMIELKDADAFAATVVAPSGGASAVLAEGQAALLPGLTASVTASDPTPLDPRLAGGAVSRLVSVSVHRPTKPTASGVAQPIDIALVMQDLAAAPVENAPEDMSSAATQPARGKASPAAPVAPQIVQRELAVLGRAVGDRDVVVLTLPFKFGGAPGEGVAAIIDVRRGTDDADHKAAIARTLQQSTESARAAVERDATLQAALAGGGASPAVRAAVAALARPEHLRPTLLFLAGETNAQLCGEVALSADDVSLVAIAAAVRDRLATPAAAADNAAIGFQIDLAVFQSLGGMLAANKLPPELHGVLARFAGEVGRNAGKMEEVARNVGTRADFNERLLAENWVSLDDSSPSARVRAFDWLRARGRTPANYDPLGSLKDRRRALDESPVGGVAP
jgi:hypothetical protein